MHTRFRYRPDLQIMEIFSDSWPVPRDGMAANQITRANAGQRLGLAVKSRVAFRHRPGVAQFHGSAAQERVHESLSRC